MRDLIATEFRRLAIKQERAERRIALSRLSGKVKEVDQERRMLRLVIGGSSTGEEVLSPWVRWQEPAAGGLRVHSQPAIGEQMALVSNSGTVGEASIAVPATYDRDHEAPSQSADTAVFARGAGRIELGPDGIVLRGPVRIEGPDLTHNGRNVGHDHKHGEVQRGGEFTGPPET